MKTLILITSLVLLAFGVGAQANDSFPRAAASLLNPQAIIDIDPPELDHTPSFTEVNGGIPLFLVRAVDNQGLASVTINVRMEGEENYVSLPMLELQGTNQYSATIDQPETDVNIEYYFLAIDDGGNRVLNGFPYEPYRMHYSTSVASSVPNSEEESTNGNSVVTWTIAGALLLALLASSSSGGSSSGGDSYVPVQVTVPRP